MSEPDPMLGSVDRALSATTRPGAGTGAEGPTDETILSYWSAWRQVEDWRRAQTVTTPDDRVVALSIMPMSSETLAEYMAHLASRGLSRSSLSRARAAIKWRHREEGHPVPDGLAALGVLRDHDHNREAQGIRVRHTVPMPIGDLVRLVTEGCDRETPRGKRDAALFLLAFAAKLSRLDLHLLDVRDVRPEPGSSDGELRLWVVRRKRLVAVPHWLTVDGRHAPVCPVEAGWVWLRWLTGRGVPVESPLFRPIDHANRVSGIDQARQGRHPQEGRLSHDGLGAVMVAAVARADLAGRGYDLRSLRAGGAAADRVSGAGVAATAADGGWAATSDSFQRVIETAESGSRQARTGAHRVPVPEQRTTQPTLFEEEPA